jgi:hypothetical protein
MARNHTKEPKLLAAAFRDGPASSDVETLITEIEAASLSSNEAAERRESERSIQQVLDECQREEI